MNKFRTINPSDDLETKVLNRIKKEEMREALVRLWSSGLISVTSLVGIIFSVLYFIQNTKISGFYNYLSLILYDGLSLLGHWKEFSMSLAESLPLMSLVIVLIFLGLLIWSVSKTTRSIRKTLLVT